MSDNYKLAPLAEGEKRVSVFQEKAPYSPLAETARAFGQGLTFGTLDEIEAALRTGSISGAEYEKQRNMLREQQKQFGEDAAHLAHKVISELSQVYESKRLRTLAGITENGLQKPQADVAEMFKHFNAMFR
jgi:hypothetical protein